MAVPEPYNADLSLPLICQARRCRRAAVRARAGGGPRSQPPKTRSRAVAAITAASDPRFRTLLEYLDLVLRK